MFVILHRWVAKCGRVVICDVHNPIDHNVWECVIVIFIVTGLVKGVVQVMQRLWLVKQLFFDFTKVVFFDVQALGGDAILFHIVDATVRIFFFQHLVDIVIDRISTSRGACECAFTPTVLLEKLVKLSQVRYPQLASIRLLFH